MTLVSTESLVMIAIVSLLMSSFSVNCLKSYDVVISVSTACCNKHAVAVIKFYGVFILRLLRSLHFNMEGIVVNIKWRKLPIGNQTDND